jgi:hypothetical protein
MQVMSEINEMGCDDLAEVAAELAFGVVTGRERAQAIAHLDRCDACREHVRQLTFTGENLLGLLPGIEPPVGFEIRVMSRFGLAGQGRRRSWTRWMLAAVAGTVIAAACGLGGWGLRGTAPAPPSTGSTTEFTLHSAALITVSHHAVGKIFLYGGSPRWLYMTVDTGSGNGTVICQLEDRAGHIITIGSFRLNGGYGYWGSPEPVPAATVAGARLTAADGRIVATARFSARK